MAFLKKLAFAACFFLLLFITTDTVQALRPGYAYDRAKILTSNEVTSLDSFCRQVETQSTAEIVVVTLSDLSDYGGDIYVAKETIFNDETLDGIVGIGKADADNGVLIVISILERKWGIEIGYGLEGDLTDSESGRIGRDIMVPFLKNEEYYNALFSGVNAVAEEISGDSAFPNEELPEYEFDTDFWVMVGVVVFIVILGIILRRWGNSGGSRRGYGYYGGGWGGGGSGGGGSGGGGSGGGGSGGGW